MESGRLRHVVTIEKKTESADTGYGEKSIVWAKFAKIRANLRPISGKELFISQQHHTESKMIADIRYMPGITNEMRLVYGGLHYNIVEVRNIDQRNRHIKLFLSEGLIE
jgi:SPP1 family predicted phage head-tail adaptor